MRNSSSFTVASTELIATPVGRCWCEVVEFEAQTSLEDLLLLTARQRRELHFAASAARDSASQLALRLLLLADPIEPNNSSSNTAGGLS